MRIAAGAFEETIGISQPTRRLGLRSTGCLPRAARPGCFRCNKQSGYHHASQKRPGSLRCRAFRIGDDQPYWLAETLTPRTWGRVVGAPMAAPTIIGKGTGLSGDAVTVRLFGSSRK